MRITDPNQILHQSIEPGFETNSAVETASSQINTQINKVNAKKENYQYYDFDFEPYQKTKVRGDSALNMKKPKKKKTNLMVQYLIRFQISIQKNLEKMN